MSSYYQNLLDQVLSDGARPTKFDCEFILPNVSLLPDSEHVRMLVKSTATPNKTHEIIDVKYKGRSIPIKGQVKYNQTWACTFYLTENHKLKNIFELWIECLDPMHNYSLDTSKISGFDEMKAALKNEYTKDIFLFQYNFDHSKITAKYQLFNCFPTEISSITYDAANVGQILDFTITFSFTHYEMVVIDEESKNYVDTFIDKVLNKVGDVIHGAVKDVGSAISGALLDNVINNEELWSGPKKMMRSIEDVIDD